MLGDLDRSVAAFLGRLLPDGTAVQFDPPAPSWAQAPPKAPLLAAYLHDIRESAQAPAADAVLARDDAGRATGWQLPVRRYRVSYLLTAWTSDGPPSQHDLLGAILVGCTTVEAIPADCLHGILATQAHPVLLSCAPADHAPAAPEFWPSLGIPARTSLNLMLVVPVIPPLITELEPPVQDLKVATENTAKAAGPGLAAPGNGKRPRVTE
ncbi:MAG TPA: Pvc16 family protein [Streptosporangiaceae bacterium]|jgi:hypothetical protein